MGMISLTGKIIIKISTTAIGFLSTALVSAVVIMLMDVTGSMGNNIATPYPILTPAKIIGKICPPRQPVDKQNSVKNNFTIPNNNNK
ncbi:hypothetical protein D3C71_1688180 [compost metagenome]